MEAFPDEGDMDMPRSLAAYRDVGYPYMVMPDHVRRSTAATPPASHLRIAVAISGPCWMRWCRARIDGDWMRSAQPKGEIAKPKRSAARPSRLSRVHKPAPAVRLTAASR